MKADEANGVFIKVQGPIFYNTPKHGDKFIMVSESHNDTTMLVFATQSDIDKIIDELLEAKSQLHKVKR
jgi:hypothetical protein